jgi:hypothetical protein
MSQLRNLNQSSTAARVTKCSPESNAVQKSNVNLPDLYASRSGQHAFKKSREPILREMHRGANDKAFG